MDVALNLTLYLPARVDVVHISVKDNLLHHLRMVMAAATFSVQLFELLEIKTLDNGINNTHRLIVRYILVGIQQKNSLSSLL